MNKQQLSEALAEPDPKKVDWGVVLTAARLVERLLPGECEKCEGAGVEAFVGFATIHTGESVFYPCPRCHGSGRVWDEEIVEVVAKYLGEFAHFSEDRARGVLSALVELLTEKGQS